MSSGPMMSVRARTIIRSMTHPFPLHASAFTMTSIPQIDVPLQMSPRDPRHWPYIGSVIEYLDKREGRKLPEGIPTNIGRPRSKSSAPCAGALSRTVRHIGLRALNSSARR